LFTTRTVQDQARRLTIEAAVPLDAFVKTWHMDARLNKGYYTADLITEILGGGASSRLYQSLVKEQNYFLIWIAIILEVLMLGF
jgi:zinc protease